METPSKIAKGEHCLSCKQVIDSFLLLKHLMSNFGSWVQFAFQAVHSNFFGLACPVYCTQPAVGLLLFCVCFGFGLGVLFSVYLGWFALGHLGLLPATPCAPRPATVPDPVLLRWARLSQYLDEPRFPRRRNN